MFDLKVKLINPNAKLPEVAHLGTDLGYDVFSAEEVDIYPGEQVIIDLGFSYEIEPVSIGEIEYHVGLIAAQPSGIAKKRFLRVHAGILDAAYRGSIALPIYNYGKTVQHICIRDKVAQLIPTLVLTSNVIKVDSLNESVRGEHGWGSGHKS